MSMEFSWHLVTPTRLNEFAVAIDVWRWYADG